MSPTPPGCRGGNKSPEKESDQTTRPGAALTGRAKARIPGPWLLSEKVGVRGEVSALLQALPWGLNLCLVGYQETT